jgi:uncharacterized membrane protein YfcA
VEQYHWLVPLGFVLGAYGTLVGAGGAFILVPILLILYPQASPETITSISLAVVFFNTASGSIAYAGTKRIDYKSGIMLSLATVPGAVVGALLTPYIPRRVFDVLLGAVLVLAAAYMFSRPNPSSLPIGRGSAHRSRRYLVDLGGNAYEFSYNPVVGLALSFVVGFLSSLLGIGGGVIHVPMLIKLLGFPAHVATATSHFMLAIMSLAATLVHIGTGAFAHGVQRTIVLSLGMIIGAQLGAILSGRLRGPLIVRGLAAALGLVGLRLLWTACWRAGVSGGG